jgi:hypothetical protein
VTCPGGAPSTIDSLCQVESSSVGSASIGNVEDCTEGSCSL